MDAQFSLDTKIKVGIIGFGRMGRFYWDAMRKSGRWDIAYICDTNPASRELAKELSCKKTAVLGYRDVLFLNEEFAPYADVVLATEDGSAGTKGNVLDAIRENGLQADVIMACGPTPMLRAIKAYAQEHGIECYLSLEEKMACGVGACLACVCKSKEVDGHSHVHNKRICKDGPVFKAEEVEL